VIHSVCLSFFLCRSSGGCSHRDGLSDVEMPVNRAPFWDCRGAAGRVDVRLGLRRGFCWFYDWRSVYEFIILFIR
jgi:hypothetical protein